MDNGNNTQLATQPKPSSLAALAGVTDAEMSLYTSFDVLTDDGKIATWNAKAEQGTPLKTMLGLPVDIENIVVYPATVVDTISGEVKKFLRMAIVSPDGTIYTGGSEGVLRDLGSLQSLFGPAPYKPPLRVVPIEIETGNKRRLFRLRVVGRVESVNPVPNTVREETSVQVNGKSKKK